MEWTRGVPIAMNVNHKINDFTIHAITLISIAEGDQKDHVNKSPFVLVPNFAREKTQNVMIDTTVDRCQTK